jgi:hypothetical protein
VRNLNCSDGFTSVFMFSNWKYLSNEQIINLENECNQANLKSLLIEYFPFPPLKQFSSSAQQQAHRHEQLSEYLMNFMYYSYSFCKEEGYNNEKISTLLSILYDIFLSDMLNQEPANTMTQSFQTFQVLILKHSVERPPKRFIYSLSLSLSHFVSHPSFR